MRYFATCFLLMSFLVTQNNGFTQVPDADYIAELRRDTRGPYAAIKWYCEDGSVRAAKDPCPDSLQGNQHAMYKTKVLDYASKSHIFLDQILTGTDHAAFWDAANRHSRVKQYQLTNFLFNVGDGWILEKAQNYRGAKQVEDEQEWGQEFLEWLVAKDARLQEHFLLMRLAFMDITHGDDTQVAQRIRALSKLLAEEDERFMEARVKLHNNPTASDVQLVSSWGDRTKDVSSNAKAYYDDLMRNLEIMYQPLDIEDLQKYTHSLSTNAFSAELNSRIDHLHLASPSFVAMEASELLLLIRNHISDENKSTARVDLIDLSIILEKLVLRHINALPNKYLGEMREKLCFLSNAIYGAGYLSTREYNQLKTDLDWMQADRVSLKDMGYFKKSAQKLVTWSSQKMTSLYTEEVSRFSQFEPLAAGFVDDKIRSSLILPAGHLIEAIHSFYNDIVGSPSQILGSSSNQGVRGLNPGFVKGILRVVPNLDEFTEIDGTAIYAFDRPPSELKPVAGILNVKEGNPVSHVQLLARNLGIPNALISKTLLSHLESFNGKEVFYAVSQNGVVKLKLADDMTDAEHDLFDNHQSAMEKFTISMDKVVLDPDSILNLTDVDASFSGKWCGPKAANLGELKQNFPSHVVDGLVLPFGIFRDHMSQRIPDKDLTYWDFLNKIFKDEEQKIKSGISKDQVEKETLDQLSLLRNLIEDMPLKADFKSNMSSKFREIFNKEIGEVPVFLRSDTNMEDLPNFTGAGLNLTIFNVLNRDEILQGIKRVWASPYTERSYQWRQKILYNPEDVYPSVLIIPSVDVDKSGVVITKDIESGHEGSISISFSHGVGGAVEGQAAESYVIHPNGYVELRSPSSETKYRTIPSTGGSQFQYATLDQPVLSDSDIQSLSDISTTISNIMGAKDGDNQAYDIELGIKDNHIWLFQVRPFVESKSALSSAYLLSLDPKLEDQSVWMEPRKN